MSPPPNGPSKGTNAPPPNAPTNAKSPAKSDDNKWDNMLGESSPEMSPEIARALLAMNPSLREQGMNTKAVLSQSRQAQTGKVAPAAPAQKIAPPKGGDIRVNEAGEKFRLMLAAEEAEVDAELKRLEQKRANLRNEMRERFASWLNGKDPELLSPYTQQLLQTEKAFLEKVGFNLTWFSAYQKTHPN